MYLKKPLTSWPYVYIGTCSRYVGIYIYIYLDCLMGLSS